MQEIWADSGFTGFYSGLGLRVVSAAGIVSLQFFVYDVLKSQFFEKILDGIS